MLLLCNTVTILVEICIKMRCFYSKNAKIAQRWKLCPQIPLPSTAGDFAPKPPVSGGRGLRPQTSNSLQLLELRPQIPANPHC